MSFRDHLTPEREDDLGFATPPTPSELRNLPDDELFRLWRKFMFANKWPFSEQAQYEMRSRLIGSLKDFKQASDRASRILIGLTVALVVLTVVLVGLTIVLVWLTLRLD